MNSLHVGRITRRALLSAAAANVLLLVAPSRPVAAPGLDLATFLQLSEKLTARRNLPPDVARRYLQSILDRARPHEQGEKWLAGEGQASLDSRIVADWYSGQTMTSGGMICVDYAGALLWEAIGFARPRGVPDTEAGRWALAPL
ncbi:MAG: sugar dehydrogenase complex small subunit [Methylocystis sp.]|uniref:sugar dehydrogenase complex small subunit n=1 Tax=Methylocystis sp. TaxID=1911079 RepID=UPI003DA6BF1C